MNSEINLKSQIENKDEETLNEIAKTTGISIDELKSILDKLKKFVNALVKFLEPVVRALNKFCSNVTKAVAENDKKYERYAKRVANRQRLYEKRRRLGRKL